MTAGYFDIQRRYRGPVVAAMAVFATLSCNRAQTLPDDGQETRLTDTVPERLKSLPGVDAESQPENVEKRFGVGAYKARLENRQTAQPRVDLAQDIAANRLIGADSNEDAGQPLDLIWMSASPQNTPVPDAPAETAALRGQGDHLYQAKCAGCHGESGDGRGVIARRLGIPPTDFTRGVFKMRSTVAGTLPSDADLFVTLTRGMHGTAMTPWSTLSEEQRWALVYRIKAFSPRFKEESPGPAVDLPAPPQNTLALQKKGKRLYSLLRCNACHGNGGKGDGPAALLYRRDNGIRPVRVRDFTRGRFLRGRTLPDIFLTLRTGFDGTPMGPYDTLPEEDLWALAAHVQTLVAQIPIPDLPPGWGGDKIHSKP